MKSSKYWFSLLLLSPFANILNYRVSEIAGFAIMIIPLGLFVLTGKRKIRLSQKEKSVYNIASFSILFIFIGIFFSQVYSIDNFYYYRFFCLSFILIPVFLIWGDSYVFIKEKLLIVLKYYIVLISGSILVGAVLKFVGLDHLEPMYNDKLYSYLTRPFGIFGQPSVNSCLLCFFYLFYRSVAKSISVDSLKRKDWLFFIVTVGVIFQGSGSGFLSYVFVLMSKFIGRKKRIPWMYIFLIGFVLGLILYYIIISNTVEKISIDYLTYLTEYVNEELIEPYDKLIKDNVAYLLWGVPDFELSLDFGPLYMSGTIGLIMTIYLFAFLFYMTKKTNSLDMKIGFILLLVGNLHYPVMFYMIMHFMWYIIVYYVLVIEKNVSYHIKLNTNN